MKQNKGIIILFFVLLILIYTIQDLITNNVEQAFLRFLSILPFAFLIISVIHNYRSKIDFISGELFIGLSLLFGTTLRTIWLTGSVGIYVLDEKKKEVLLNQELSDLYFPLLLINIGVICFLLGKKIKINFFNFNSLRKTKSFIFNTHKLRITLIVGVLISFVGMYFLLKSVGVEQIVIENISEKRRTFDDDGQRNSFAWIRSFGRFSKYCFFLGMTYLYVYKLKKSKQTLIIFLTFLSFMTSTVYSIVTSSRSAILELFLVAFVIIVISGKKIPKKLVLVTGISAILLAGLIISLRNNDINDSSFENKNSLEAIVGNNNLFGVSKTGRISNYVLENNSYYFGTTYFTWMFAPIPRSIWEEKPPVTPGLIVRRDILGEHTSNNVGGGVPPGFIAEAFMNFGYFGVILFSLLWGSFIQAVNRKTRFINETKTLHPIDPITIIITSIILIEFTFKLSGGSLTQALLNVFEAVIILKTLSSFKYIQYGRK
jgi:oligosaccharide repeat unit polymerase